MARAHRGGDLPLRLLLENTSLWEMWKPRVVILLRFR
jgi:hypothetical protein